MNSNNRNHQQNRGSWKSHVAIEHLALSSQISEPQFSSNGKYLSFVVSTDGMDHLWMFTLIDDAINGLQRITAIDPLKGNALYGGGVYCWNRMEKNIIYYCGKEKSLQKIDLDDGISEVILPFDLKTAAPTESPSGQLACSVFTKKSMYITMIDLNDKPWPQPLEPRTDFAIDPHWSHNGSHLAWHAWNFPNMAWDESFIVINDGHSLNHERVIKKENTAMGQPRWSPHTNQLAFLSDGTGWYNLWLLEDVDGTEEPLLNESAEHGYPTWVAGLQTFDWTQDGSKIVSIRNKDGMVELISIEIATKEVEVLPFPKGWYHAIVLHPSKNKAVTIYSSPTVPPRLQLHDLDTGTCSTLYQSAPLFPSKELVEPRHVTFPTSRGDQARALLYARDWDGLENAPTIINVHGGPTSQRGFHWNDKAQFFTSRGYLYVELNYRGSTGYGRDYVQKLTRNWGILDTDDAHYLVKYLEQKGYSDPNRVAIMGGSAGGYLVLNALIRYPDTFTCGIDLYGVTDLFHLAEHTHYFESRYTEMLVGPLPESADEYKARSPIFHADAIKSPLLVLQGAKDEVVPKEQSDEIVKTLEKKGRTVRYKVYENEGHGFKYKETIMDAYREILQFLQHHLLYQI